MDIATGRPQDHPTPLPLDARGLPGVQSPTPRFPEGSEQGGVRDTTGERQAQLAASEAEWSAAMSAGMDARTGMLAHYQADILPQGTSYGDAMTLPPVPEDSTAPAADFLYGTGGGDQPGRGA